jgi:hypothetical protein
MDSSIKNLKKLWLSSLSFLEHNIVYSVIVFIVVIYTLGLFDGINSFIGGLYNYLIIRFIVIILIIWIAPKDPTLAILLALSYAVSLHYLSSSETFVAPVSEEHHKMNLPGILYPNMATNESFLSQVSEEHNRVKIPYPMKPTNESFSSKYSNMQEEHSKIISTEEDHSKKKHHKKSQQTSEHFFPLMNSTQENFFPLINQNESNNTEPAQLEKQNNSNSCSDMYVPQYETVGNVCDTVATFQGELNAQGINTNSPEGFNSTVIGSPLN